MSRANRRQGKKRREKGNNWPGVVSMCHRLQSSDRNIIFNFWIVHNKHCHSPALLSSFCSFFFSTPLLIGRRSTLTGQPVTVKVKNSHYQCYLTVISVSVQLLLPLFPLLFFKEVHTKTHRPDNKPFVMSWKTLSFFPLVVTPSAASWLRPLRPPGFSQAPTEHQ